MSARLAALAGAALLALAGAVGAAPLTFVALGDAPYGDKAREYPRYEALIGAINAAAPDLVIHVGDVKSGASRCDDQTLLEQLAYLNSFAAPTLYTPGDNEWTDCGRKKAGRFDPEERLAFLRARFFADPGKSLGARRMTVTYQGAAGYPENARLTIAGVTFVTAHIVGSNNNKGRDGSAERAEYKARWKAGAKWVRTGFLAAPPGAPVVVAIHADMFRDDFDKGDEDWRKSSGYRKFGRALKKAAAAHDGPALLIFGDSHRFRVLQPFPKAAPNLTALEVFGPEAMNAVRVTAGGPGGFAFQVIRNPAHDN